MPDKDNYVSGTSYRVAVSISHDVEFEIVQIETREKAKAVFDSLSSKYGEINVFAYEHVFSHKSTSDMVTL